MTVANPISSLATGAAPLRRRVARAVKVSWEWPAALVGLMVLAPLLLLVALAIRLESRGPAVYRQVRVGRHHREFVMYKFRTMSVDADRRRGSLAARNEADGPLFKIQDDPRITRLGRF